MGYKKNEKKQKQHLLWQPIDSDKVSVKRSRKRCFFFCWKRSMQKLDVALKICEIR